MRKVGLKMVFITFFQYPNFMRIFWGVGKKLQKIFFIEESIYGSIISPSLVDVSFV